MISAIFPKTTAPYHITQNGKEIAQNRSFFYIKAPRKADFLHNY
jgi:hypothetical protein